MEDAKGVKVLCSFWTSRTTGERLIQCTEGLRITNTPGGFIVDDLVMGVFGLRFNKDGLQTDRDGNVLSDPYYWLE